MSRNRSLYDEVYLKEGCRFPFDKETFVDNHAWTYGTCFGVMAVCFVAFVKLYFFPHNSSVSRCTRKPSQCLIPAYFLLTGISHGISGISHYVVERTTDPIKRPLEMAAQWLVSAASILALILCLAMVGTTPQSKLMATRVLWWLVVISYSAEMICVVIFRYEVLGGIDLHSLLAFGILLLLFFLYIAQSWRAKSMKSWHYMIKAVALLTVIGALCYSFMFYPKCGSLEAYRSCFEECPLPKGMNQKSFFNIALMFGLSGWAWSEDSFPTIRPRKIRDDLTIISTGSGSSSSELGMDSDLEDMEEGESSAVDTINNNKKKEDDREARHVLREEGKETRSIQPQEEGEKLPRLCSNGNNSDLGHHDDCCEGSEGETTATPSALRIGNAKDKDEARHQDEEEEMEIIPVPRGQEGISMENRDG